MPNIWIAFITALNLISQVLKLTRPVIVINEQMQSQPYWNYVYKFICVVIFETELQHVFSFWPIVVVFNG